MAVEILFGIIMAFIIIRAVAYGIYSVKNTGAVGGISIFFLAACALAAGYAVVHFNQI